jgi:putative glutamine amidotransferase
MKGAPFPLVLVPACTRSLEGAATKLVGAQYVAAVRFAGAMPWIVPDATPEEMDALLGLADGVLLTGSPSNVHPAHFGEQPLDDALPLDPVRDAWTLPLVPRALACGIPLLAICRGAQEVNVALGGSLYQAVHQADGFADHRERADDPIAVQYGPAHDVLVQPGGLLERLLPERRFPVNSLHGQAVHRTGRGVFVEARAPDGVVEAFSVPEFQGRPCGFNLGVQWHPEWEAQHDPVSRRLLQAFGEACRRYRERRLLGAAHGAPAELR